MRQSFKKMVRQLTLLAEVFNLVASIPSLFMAAFTATVLFPGEKKSPGKKTVVVKTAMKRLGNRSDKIKNLC